MRSSALTVSLGCVPLLSTEFFTVRLAMVMATSQQPDCPSGGLSSFMGLPGTSMLMEWGGQGSSELPLFSGFELQGTRPGTSATNWSFIPKLPICSFGGGLEGRAEGTHRVTHTLPCPRGREQQGLWVKQRQLALLQYTSDSAPWCPECAAQEPASTVQLHKCPAPPGPEP